MTFWYRYGSGSADPNHWLTDPDPDPAQKIYLLFSLLKCYEFKLKLKFMSDKHIHMTYIYRYESPPLPRPLPNPLAGSLPNLLDTELRPGEKRYGKRLGKKAMSSHSWKEKDNRNHPHVVFVFWAACKDNLATCSVCLHSRHQAFPFRCFWDGDVLVPFLVRKENIVCKVCLETVEGLWYWYFWVPECLSHRPRKSL